MKPSQRFNQIEIAVLNIGIARIPVSVRLIYCQVLLLTSLLNGCRQIVTEDNRHSAEAANSEHLIADQWPALVRLFRHFEASREDSTRHGSVPGWAITIEY